MGVYRGRVLVLGSDGRRHVCVGKVVSWEGLGGVPRWQATLRFTDELLVDLADGDEVKIVLVDFDRSAVGHVDARSSAADWVTLSGASLAPV